VLPTSQSRIPHGMIHMKGDKSVVGHPGVVDGTVLKQYVANKIMSNLL